MPINWLYQPEKSNKYLFNYNKWFPGAGVYSPQGLGTTRGEENVFLQGWPQGTYNPPPATPATPPVTAPATTTEKATTTTTEPIHYDIYGKVSPRPKGGEWKYWVWDESYKQWVYKGPKVRLVGGARGYGYGGPAKIGGFIPGPKPTPTPTTSGISGNLFADLVQFRI